MTKADLIEEVSRVAEIKNKEAEVVVDTILASIVDTVRGGGRVEIRGFGSFRTRSRSGRAARNPATGEPVTVPPKAIAFFKPSKEVLQLINSGRPS
jgi:integration host factor subunit beta